MPAPRSSVEAKPGVSIIIPAYNSEATLAGCLRALERQTVRDFEIILIDSSPLDLCATIIREERSRVIYEHVRSRMLPHEARNYGVGKASAPLLLFTDPDIYPPPEWISQIIETHARLGDVIVGSVRCYGTKWLDQGVHLAKFDLWLPGGSIRPTEIAPTLNLLCPRDIFEQVGGFHGERMIGDTMFSWDLRAAGVQIWFNPHAEVFHHHVSTLSGLLRERYRRGKEFGLVRAERAKWPRVRLLLHLMLTLLPLRWMNLVVRTVRCALRANMASQALWTFPIYASAHTAWLLGEARSYLDTILCPHEPAK